MERNIYSKPFMTFEEFTPQDFVASCELADVAHISGDRQYLRLDIDYNNHYGNGGVLDPEFGGNAFYLSPSPLHPGVDCEIINMNVYRYLGDSQGSYDSNAYYLDKRNFRLVATQVLKRTYNGKVYYYTYKPGGDYTSADLDYFPVLTSKNRS